MSTIFVMKEGKKWGPYTTEELEGHVEAGAFSGTDLMWTEGMEDWAPLESVLVHIDNDWTDYLDEEGVHITDQWVQLEEKNVPLDQIAKAHVQTEKIHRTKPMIGTILLGVGLLCAPFVFLELVHEKTLTTWAVAIGVFLVLLFVWLRLLYTAIRPARSMVVLDLRNGDERLLQIKPSIAPAVEQALHTALANFRIS